MRHTPLSLSSSAAGCDAAAALAGATAHAANIADIDLTLTLTFEGAFFTDTGNGAIGDGLDYEFNDLFTDNFSSILPNPGEIPGVGAVSSAVTIDGVDFEDYEPFGGDHNEPFTEDSVIEIALHADASSMPPNSGIFATLTETTELGFDIYVDEAITFSFAYEYEWILSMDNPAPTGGSAFGVAEFAAESMSDNEDILFADFIEDFETGLGDGNGGGPTNITLTGGGQLQFELGPDESFVEFEFETRVGAGAFVDEIPAPGAATLLAIGSLAITRRRRA